MSLLHQFGKSLNDFALPTIDEDLVEEQPDIEDNRLEAERIRLLLNDQDAAVSDAILQALGANDNMSAKVFFLDGPGGTGKTYTYNYIIKETRARSFSVSTSAWTGYCGNFARWWENLS